MGFRRKSRELALQMLFQLDVNSDGPNWRKQFWALHPAPAEVKTFAEQLVDGVLEHKEEIDHLIQKHAVNWTINRMSIIDRNILRCAVYELMRLSDIPAKVTMNEAIEIAKRYSDEESGAFVNGILDHIVKEEFFAKKE